MAKKAKDLRPKALQGVRNPDLYDKNGNLFERINQAASQAAYDEYAAHTGRLGHDVFKEGNRFTEQHYDYSNPLWHLGESTWDSPSLNNATPEDMYDARANNQPWWSQWGSGALKMVGTAATTFIDNTLGMIVGLGTGIDNLTDGDDKTGFMDGIWNNKVTNSMADISEKMEKALPNYMTQWEQNAPWYQRIFSGEGGANFWANDILKNAGFTIGAAASMYAMSGAGNLLKGIKGVSTLGKGLGLINEAGDVTKAGKFAAGTAKLITSTIGESATEALSTYRDNAKLMDQNLTQAIQSRRAEAMQRYKQAIANGMDETLAHSVLNRDLSKIETDAQAYKDKMDKTLIDASNAVMGVNMAVLSLSNYLSLGSLVKGGYGNAKSLLDMATKTVDGKAVTSTTDIAKGMLNGTLKFESPEIKHGMAKVAGRWALDTTQEGLEEGVQGLASTTAQMNTQGKMNRWAKKNSCLGSMINPDATEACADFATALGQAYEEQFGNAGSSGWSEVAAGFISGALGVGGMHRNKNNKLRPTWEGGLKEAYESVYGEKNAMDEAIGMMNKSLTSGEFGERVRNAVANMAIKSKKDEALAKKDIQGYKNAETEELLFNALHAKDMGMLDSYMEMFDELEKGVSDADVEELKTLAANENGTSSLEGMSEDKIKERYREKARKSKAKLKKSLEEYDRADEQYGDKFSPETRRFGVQQIAFQNTLLWDTYERMKEMDKEIDELKTKKQNNDITASEETLLDEKTKAYKGLQKQATQLRDSLNETKRDPSKLQAYIEKMQDIAQKQQLYRDAEKASAKLQEANTVGDILDVYENSPQENREDILNQAIKQSEGETKTKLQQFKDYMEDTAVLSDEIAKLFPLTDPENAEDNLKFQQAFNMMLDEIKEDILHDDSPVLSRQNIKDRLLAKVKEFTDKRDKALDYAGGVIYKDGSIFYDEALKNGTVDKDDFYSMVNENDEVQLMAGDRLKDMAQKFVDSQMFDKIATNLQSLTGKLDILDDLKKSRKKPDPKKSKRNTEERKKKESETPEEVIFEDDEAPSGEGKASEEEEKRKRGKVDDDDEIDFASMTEENPDEHEGPTEKPSSEDEEKPKPQPKPKSKDILTKEEKKNYNETTKTGKVSGWIYHIVNPKKGYTPDKGKGLQDGDSVYEKISDVASAIRKFKYKVNQGITKNELGKALTQLRDVIDKNPCVNDLMKSIEDFFKEKGIKFKKEEPKPKPKTASSVEKASTLDEETKGKKQANSYNSLNGSTNPMYVKSKMKQGNFIYYAPKNSLQEFFENMGVNPSKNTMIYLPEVLKNDKDKSVEESTPVHYLYHKDRPQDVILAIKPSDANIKTGPNTKLISIEGEQYLIIGNLGYDEMYRPETKAMFQGVLEECTANLEEGAEWYVSANTNRIKDMTAGYLINQMDGERKVKDLGNILNDKESNPYDLDVDSLKWLVIEGKEDKPAMKKIKVNLDKETAYGVPNGKPGQVYVYIPTGLGDYVPAYVETLFFKEWVENPKAEGSTIQEMIQKRLTTLADPEADFEAKKKAIGELRDYLVFSPANTFHVNNADYKRAPNSIWATINGIAQPLIDFNEETTGQENMKKIGEALEQMNPRMAVNTTILENRPKDYIDAGILTSDIQILGTVGHEFFLYPTDPKTNKMGKAKKVERDLKPTFNSKQKEYLNGKYYYTDGVDFFNVKLEKITDSDEVDRLTTALAIKQGKIKAQYTEHSAYFTVGSEMYVDNGHGGLTLLTKKEAEQAEKLIKAYEKKKARDKKLAEEAEKAEKAKGKESKDEDENPFNLDLMLNGEEQEGPSEEKGNEYEAGFELTQDFPDGRKVTTHRTFKIEDWNSLGEKKSPMGEVAKRLKGTQAEWHYVETLEPNGSKHGEYQVRRNADDDWHTPDALLEILKGNPKNAEDLFGLNESSSPLEDTQEKAKHFGIHKDLKIDDKYIGTPKALTLDMIPKLSALPDDRKELKALYDLTDGNLMIAEDRVDPVIHVIVDKKPMFLVEAYYKFILNKDITETTNPNNSEEKPGKEKKNFVNGTDISELKTAKELEESRNSDTFVAELQKDSNEDILNEFYDLAIERYGLDDDASVAELVKELAKHGVNILSTDVKTELDNFKTCG